MNRTVLSLAVLASSLWSVRAPAQVTLAWKFPDGAVATSVTQVSAGQTLKIEGGNEIVTSSKLTLNSTSTSGARNADGVLLVKHKIDALRAELDIAGQQLSFDSAKADAPPPGTALDAVLDVFKAAAKSEWTVTRDRANKVVSVDGRGKAFESLPEQMRSATQKQFEPIYLTQVANDEMAAIPGPDNPVKKGDTWTLKTTMRLDGGQTFTFDKTFRYDGAENGLHTITESTTGVVYDMEATPGSPLGYVSSDLKIADSKGTILFDSQLGQIVSRHVKVHITGPMTFEAGGNELPATVDLTLEQSTKTEVR